MRIYLRLRNSRSLCREVESPGPCTKNERFTVIEIQRPDPVETTFYHFLDPAADPKYCKHAKG